MVKKIIKPINPSVPRPIFNFSSRSKYIFLAFLAFIFYANTIPNKYAFDDDLAIQTNAYVQMGFSGIPKILTNDAYAGYYTYWGADPTKQLSGGRYRPLSQLIFATGRQFFSNSALPYFLHLINVLSFIFCILVIFHFLEKFLLKKLPYGSDIAFVAAFLFAIHPLHTEVVANIKSLDEILSLIFIFLTFIFSIRYMRERKISYLVISACSFFLALLSKEYAVTLLFFIPLLFYLLEDKKPLDAIMGSIPYYGIFMVYLILRYNAVGFHSNVQSDINIGNNPYLYATHFQKIATEWFVLGKYFWLLIFPYPLSYDYSYYQIPYHNFSDLLVLLSLVIYVIIGCWGIVLVRKKSVLSFAVLFFLFTILMISNFVFDIGATMGERLVFHSSLGFFIIISYFLFTLTSGLSKQIKKTIIIGGMSVIGVLSFGETFIRNSEWKDDTSLDIHDVSIVPNSYLANNNAGRCYLMLSEKKDITTEQAQQYRDSARKCLFRSLHFDPKNEFTYINLGFVYMDEGKLDSARYWYDIIKGMNPYFPLKSYYTLLSKNYFDKGLSLAKDAGKPREGINYMRKALLIDSTNESIWYDLGVAYYHTHQYDSERYALLKTLQYKPDSFDAAGAKKYLQELSKMKD